MKQPHCSLSSGCGESFELSTVSCTQFVTPPPPPPPSLPPPPKTGFQCVLHCTGAVLSAKAQSDQQLHEARNHARKLIHAFHKCQDKLDTAEVCIVLEVQMHGLIDCMIVCVIGRSILPQGLCPARTCLRYATGLVCTAVFTSYPPPTPGPMPCQDQISVFTSYPLPTPGPMPCQDQP